MTLSLSRNNIDIGKRFLRFLDNTQDKPSTMMWVYIQDRWVLFVGVPSVVNDETAEEIFGRLEKSLKRIHSQHINLSVTGKNYDLFQMTGMMVQTGPDDVSDIISQGNRVNGTVLPDAHIYRLFL